MPKCVAGTLEIRSGRAASFSAIFFYIENKLLLLLLFFFEVFLSPSK